MCTAAAAAVGIVFGFPAAVGFIVRYCAGNGCVPLCSVGRRAYSSFPEMSTAPGPRSKKMLLAEMESGMP